MARQPEHQTLTTAWRALAGSSAGSGWSTIPVVASSRFRLLAARHFPGKEEAILVGFSQPAQVPHFLPEAKGFLVSRLELGPSSAELIWFALVRRPAGNLDIFTVMAADILKALNGAIEGEDPAELFIERIQAWQNFMQKSSGG